MSANLGWWPLPGTSNYGFQSALGSVSLEMLEGNMGPAVRMWTPDSMPPRGVEATAGCLAGSGLVAGAPFSSIWAEMPLGSSSKDGPDLINQNPFVSNVTCPGGAVNVNNTCFSPGSDSAPPFWQPAGAPPLPSFPPLNYSLRPSPFVPVNPF